MLTPVEKVMFLIFGATCVGYAALQFRKMVLAIARGTVEPLGNRWWLQIGRAMVQVLLHRTLLRTRRPIAVFHFFIFAAFSYYMLVNFLDFIEGYTGFTTLRKGGIWKAYNLAADVLSVLALVGMVFFLIRRFMVKPRSFTFNDSVILLPGVVSGIRRDSAIVGGFILLHVGSRWAGQILKLVLEGPDPWQPLASTVSTLIVGVPTDVLTLGSHITWWLSLGLILLFLPYFPKSKHIHLFFAPVNLSLGHPSPPGQLHGTQGQVKAARALEDFPWRRILDSYACIMCNRCQDACPAHTSGRALSPAALEINKRYYLNRHLTNFSGGASSPPLWDYAISTDAIWACTTCSACIDICPVGNAPMQDIVMLRRALVDDGALPDPNLQDVLLKLSKYGNSFGKPPRLRGHWARTLPFSVKDARSEPVEVLWFVGDFASFDPRVQEISRRIARLLHHAGVDFGILYDGESNSGNDVRRVGEEGLFEILAERNISALDKACFELVVTADPHSLNALRHDYRRFGKSYRALHYTELLVTLFAQGKLVVSRPLKSRVTYHDPCYLARYCNITEAPRRLIELTGAELVEMPRNGANTFCCGAGGGRIWMTETPGKPRPSELRIQEAVSLGADTFVVACPKDYVMYTDAVKTSGTEGRIVVKDIVELVEEAVAVPVEETVTA
jgi:Fe-S oxidoreductase